MMHLGLSLKDSEEGIPDLHLDSSGNLVFVSDGEAVGQHVSQRLKTFQGEWYLDTEAGMTWLSDILGEDYDPTLAESIVKAEISNTHGVRGINSFSVKFDKKLRQLSAYAITVETEYDEDMTL